MVVIFDLDRTITKRGTFTPFLLAYARKYRPPSLLMLPIIILMMLAYVAAIISRSYLKEKMVAIFLGNCNQTQLADFANEFAAHSIDAGCFERALASIEQHRANGDTLVLATASFDFTATAFSRSLGFTHTVATRSLWKDNLLIAKIDGDNCYGKEKLRRVRDGFQELGFELRTATMYTDHHSDIPLFECVGQAIAVNPTRLLRNWIASHPSAQLGAW